MQQLGLFGFRVVGLHGMGFVFFLRDKSSLSILDVRLLKFAPVLSAVKKPCANSIPFPKPPYKVPLRTLNDHNPLSKARTYSTKAYDN